MQITFSKATSAILDKSHNGHVLTQDEVDTLRGVHQDRLEKAETYTKIATHHINTGKPEHARAARNKAAAFWKQAVMARVALRDQGAVAREWTS